MPEESVFKEGDLIQLKEDENPIGLSQRTVYVVLPCLTPFLTTHVRIKNDSGNIVHLFSYRFKLFKKPETKSGFKSFQKRIS